VDLCFPFAARRNLRLNDFVFLDMRKIYRLAERAKLVPGV